MPSKLEFEGINKSNKFVLVTSFARHFYWLQKYNKITSTIIVQQWESYSSCFHQ